MRIVRRRRLRVRAMLLAMVVAAVTGGAAAQSPATFADAWQRTSADYQAAMRILETRGSEETAAAVHRLRQSFQDLAERFVADRPAHLVNDPDWPAEFLQIDVRLVGTLLVIDMGSRDGARRSLAPLADVLTRLHGPEPVAR